MNDPAELPGNANPLHDLNDQENSLNSGSALESFENSINFIDGRLNQEEYNLGSIDLNKLKDTGEHHDVDEIMKTQDKLNQVKEHFLSDVYFRELFNHITVIYC